MPFPLSRERLDLEWKVLCSLCRANIDPTSRYGISLALQPVHFREPSNRIVFEEIRALGAIPRDRFRELLPARVNNRGVPDFNFDSLFAAENVTLEELKEIAGAVRALRELYQVEADSLFGA